MQPRYISTKRSIHKTVTSLTLATLLLQATGCGTLIYPERRGQTGGRIDPAVAILNGVGVIVFVIPGLIAFAVDFATGAIYLPPGKSGKHSAADQDVRIVIADEGRLTAKRIEEIVARETGRYGVMEHQDLRAERIASLDQARASIRSPIAE